MKFQTLSRRDYSMLIIGFLFAAVCIGVFVLIRNAQTPLKPETNTITTPWLPDTVKRWKNPINEMSKNYDIDPNLLAIVMTLESGGYSKAKSNAGAEGLMQVTPSTAKDIAARLLEKPRKSYKL